jgi:hypothetical protein
VNEPITTWEAAAQVLGISYATLWRRRKEFASRDPFDRAHFRDADEVWAWWRALTARPEKPAPKPRTKRAPPPDTPFDGKKMMREFNARRGGGG